MNIRNPRPVCFVSLSILLCFQAGCRRTSHTTETTSHSWEARGVIEKISADHREATIHHETIPGYMMEMTMDFPVRNPVELEGVTPGDKVTFTLTVTNDKDWITNVHRFGHTELAAKPISDGVAEAVSRLQPGDLVPDGDLVSENGTRVRLSDFRGKVLAISFFFSRCPLPTYCPLMNRNFGVTRKILLSESPAFANWQFLSISFDSEFDQPATLSKYAEEYRSHDSDRWLFAAAPPATLVSLAPPLGLVIMKEGSGITHNLRTLVIDPLGKLSSQFNDNAWTPQQLADAMLKASRGQADAQAK